MKKLNTVRLAALLLTLCLASSAFVGSTLAKYTTEATGSDSARVAKWGVKLELSGSNFGTEYIGTDNNVTVKVDTSDSKNLVAPGTSDDEGVTMKISGTPEVEVRVTASMPQMQDVYLKAGTYRDYTKSDPNATFTLTEDYHPIKFSINMLKGKYYEEGTGVILDAADVPYSPVIDQPLSEVERFLEKDVNMDYPPEFNMETVCKLVWKWDFDGNNAADTLLANIMAGIETGVDESLYSTDIKYQIDYRADQVD